MFERMSLRLQRKIEKSQYQLIQLVSVRRTYREKRDKKRFRSLVDIPKEITLSEQQVIGATSHARETLLVAGAGSGKTFVLVGRAKYLIKSKRVPPENILMLAFNREAAKEIADRTKSSGIDVKAQTFHSFGNSVLLDSGQRTGAAFGNDGELPRFINNFISDGIDEAGKQDLANYFTYESVPKRTFESFKDLEEYKNYVRSVVPKTLNDEYVKSHGEWIIANFLFQNSINYEYEAVYKANNNKSSMHRPDFVVKEEKYDIWIEYFGIDRKNNTAPGVNKDKYVESIEWKMKTHKENGTKVIDLYFYELLEGNILEKLEKELKKLGVKSKLRKPQEILDAANKIGHSSRFNRILEQFLRHSRAKRLNTLDLENISKGNERNEKFISIFNKLYDAYFQKLTELELPDFAEQIHAAADAIESGLFSFNFTHVLVDEFQDISFDRFRLLKAMQSANSKIEMTYVGDDWQSIYRFSGSDINIMRELSKPKMNRKRVDLENTYRLPQEIADISSKFIMKNPNQLEKTVISKTEENDKAGVFVHWMTDSYEQLANIEKVIEFIGKESNNPESSLRVLARYKSNLPKLKDIENLWQGPVNLSTIHAAKGLESDYVIVVDLLQDIRGFPSTIEDDPVLEMVLPKFEEFEHEEERRLFYVAITRSLQQTHLITSNQKPSLFATEMLKENLGIHIGLPINTNVTCPVCAEGTIMSKNENFFCSNNPTCTFFTPFCSTCKKPMEFINKVNQRYICSKHPKNIYRNCKRCDWGVLVPRINSYSNEEFFSCHTWKSTKCAGR
jgi:DNA helicase-4